MKYGTFSAQPVDIWKSFIHFLFMPLGNIKTSFCDESSLLNGSDVTQSNYILKYHNSKGSFFEMTDNAGVIVCWTGTTMSHGQGRWILTEDRTQGSF